MNTNQFFEENIMLNHDISLVFEEKDTKTKKNAKDKICKFTPLIKMPNSEKIFFIYGDILINLYEDNQQLFFDQLKFHNSFRPIQTIKREKESLFLRIEFNNEKQGQTELNPLISMMQTMQNQEYYEISKKLEQYQSKLKIQLYQYNTFDPLLKIQRKNTIRYFKDVSIPQLLKQQYLENPLEIQAYGLVEFFDSIYDSRVSEFGHNQNFLHLVGTDFETIEQFYLREGWFSAFCSSNNSMIKKHLEKIIEQYYYKMNNKFEKYQTHDTHSVQFLFQTLDQVDMYGLFQEKTYYIYQNSQYLYTDTVVLENMHNLIGLFSILSLDISSQSIQILMEKRQNINLYNQNNLLNKCNEMSLSKFQYEIQSQFLINKYQQKDHLKACKIKFNKQGKASQTTSQAY